MPKIRRTLKERARGLKQKAKSVGEATEERIRARRAKPVTEPAGGDQSSTVGSDITRFARARGIPWRGSLTSSKFAALADALHSSQALSRSVAESLLNRLRPAFELSAKRAKTGKSNSALLLNALLASDFSHTMESWLGNLANVAGPSIYDQAMDATYKATHIGGGQLHRLFDGSHTLWGAWDKVEGATSEDTLLQEMSGYVTALGKDLSTHVGLPIFGMSKPSYDQIAGVLSDTFHIRRAWFQDLLHVNGVELIGASIGTVAVALNWKKAEVDEFSGLAGSLGLSSIASANPALAVVALVTLAKSFNDAKHKGDYSEFVDGLAKGGIGTGAFLLTGSVVGGPPVVGLVAGMCVGMAVHQAMKTVTVSEVSHFVETSIKREVSKTDVSIQA